MAEGNANIVVPATSGVAIARNLAVKLDTTNSNAVQRSVDLCGAGEQAYGVTGQTTTETNKDVEVIVFGAAHMVVDGNAAAIAAGDYLLVNASGQGVKSTTDLDKIVAIAEQASTTAGELIRVFVVPPGTERSIA